jgi:tight adherence protein B
MTAMHLYPYLIASLFMASMGGLAYVILHALSDGADAYSGEYSEETAKQFEDIFLFIPPRRFAEIGWAAAARTVVLVVFHTRDITTIAGFTVGMVFGMITGGIMLRMPHVVLMLLKKRRTEKFNIQLVDTLVSMSNALKAGFSITQAFESVARDGENPIAQEFGLLLQQTRLGISFSEALQNLAERVTSDDLTLVVLSIETARQTGGNLTEVFDRIDDTIRERRRIEGKIKALTAQGRIQGRVVGAMPVVLGIVLYFLDPVMMMTFIRSQAGIIVLLIVLVLEVCGALIIRKIVDIDV